MRPIRFVQWSSSIGIAVVSAWVIVTTTVLLAINRADMIRDLLAAAGIVGAFLAPEKLAAFFGPVVKRRQEGKQHDST